MAQSKPLLAPQRQRQAREFATIRYRLRLIRLAVLLLYLAVLIFGGAAGLWQWLGSPLLFVGALLGIKWVIDLPLDYYGHLLARRYGISVQRAAGWMADEAKGFAVGLLLNGAGALLILRLWERMPQTWYLWTALIIALLTILLTYLAPVLIAPLFHKYAPLGEGELTDRLLSLSQRAGVSVRGVFVSDVSRKSTALNASLSGLGATRRIVLFDTLVQTCSPEEVEVVLAHEMGHHIYHHITKMTFMSTLFIGGTFLLAGLVVEPVSLALGLGGLAPAALPLVLLLLLGIGLPMMPVFMAISRQWERDCDRFALKLTGNPPAFISAFEKLADRNLADLDPPRWVYYFLMSHPPIPERIAMAEGWDG